ncbi:2OG-Fe(II) oxygenase family protein [Nocardia amikacinitolerans]|uniref:2OG-Fe(II) oxygenase family protein n=1 Tax=Nocardia amikacinitolerans TaxID=756689 RepID=UPI0020A4A8B6|nr:2OG-Fe(II) oxygenase family protein [Nocardia amikacinitolerans]MCP2279469.1 Isopenicillin N synthase [Nocardia amikacinitolerans]
MDIDDNVNKELRKFGVVDKDLDYTLEESPDDVFDDSFAAPVCDMSDLKGDATAQRRFVDMLGRAMEDTGLAILINHGIDTDSLRATDACALELFASVPEEQKLKFAATDYVYGGAFRRGYFAVQQWTPTRPNAVEAWEFFRDSFRLPGEDYDKALTFWPDEKFEAGLRPYWQACEELTLPLVRALLRYLNIDPSIYDEELSPPNGVLRINHYPAFEGRDSGAENPGRFMTHEDYGLITLLPANPIEGLQVFHPQRKTWSRVTAPEGSMILNSGDWLQMVSNDRFRSCSHRVCAPREPGHRAVSRISVPYLVLPREASVLEVWPGCSPKYSPIGAKDFMAKLAGKYVDYDA